MLERDDNLVISISGISEVEETFFSLVKRDQGSRAGSYNGRLQIVYGMNLDAEKVCRQVYTFWTVVGEVGGLSGVLIYLTAKILSVLNHNKSDNHLVSQLFRTSDPDASVTDEPQTKVRLNSDR